MRFQNEKKTATELIPRPFQQKIINFLKRGGDEMWEGLSYTHFQVKSLLYSTQVFCLLQLNNLRRDYLGYLLSFLFPFSGNYFNATSFILPESQSPVPIDEDTGVSSVLSVQGNHAGNFTSFTVRKHSSWFLHSWQMTIRRSTHWFIVSSVKKWSFTSRHLPRSESKQVIV